MPKTDRTRSLLVAVAAVVLTASFGLGLHAAGAIAPVLAKDQAVTIVDYAFQPKTITINQHESVTWTNTANQNHTVTADDGSFDSGELSHGDVFGNVFDTAGTFKYHCSIHPDMQGTIIVKAVAATPTPSGSQPPTPPPGTLPPGFSPHPVITGPPEPTPRVSEATTVAPSPTPGTGSPAERTDLVTWAVALALAVAALVLLFVFSRRRRRP
jgi:plastocyanin